MTKYLFIRGEYFRPNNSFQLDLPIKNGEQMIILSCKFCNEPNVQRMKLLDSKSTLMGRLVAKILTFVRIPRQINTNLHKFIKSADIVVITEAFTFYSFYAALLRKYYSYKLILHTGEIYSNTYTNVGITKLTRKFVERNVDGIIFANEYSQINNQKKFSQINNQKKLPHKNIFQYGNYVARENIQYQEKLGKVRKLFFGHKICQEKGADIIVDCLDDLYPRINKVTLIGNIYDLSKSQKITLNKYVRIGFVSHYEKLPWNDYIALMSEHDTFVFLNRRMKNNVEQFGIAPLEAMSAGLRVIASRVGGPGLYLNESNSWYASDTKLSLLSAIDEINNSSKNCIQTKLQNAYQTAEKYDATQFNLKKPNLVKFLNFIYNG